MQGWELNRVGSPQTQQDIQLDTVTVTCDVRAPLVSLPDSPQPLASERLLCRAQRLATALYHLVYRLNRYD